MNRKLLLLLLLAFCLSWVGAKCEDEDEDDEEEECEDNQDTTGDPDAGAGETDDANAICSAAVSGDEQPFAYAKMLIEHNATDADTGFQGALDGSPWKKVTICGPQGSVLSVEAKGNMVDVGLTELFYETQEPSNEAVPIPDWLTNLPAGQYTFKGETVEGQALHGVATFTHAIPAEPVITAPDEDAVVSPDEDLVITWEPVTQTIDGASVAITHYQLIVELEEPGWDEHSGFGASIFSVHVPAATTSMRVPSEFLVPGSPYEFEILAIEESGNQTIAARAFETSAN